MTSATRVSSRRPSEPPGCERAKSSTEKPRASSTARASASPSASAAVVLAVGARPSGQASVSTAASRCTSDACASDDRLVAGEGDDARALALEVRHQQHELVGLAGVRQHHTTSSAVIMPRSPWAASAGCTKNAGVPVEASVAASLRATWPDLPMPETTTRPRAGQHQRRRPRRTGRPGARRAPRSRAPRYRARRARARARARRRPTWASGAFPRVRMVTRRVGESSDAVMRAGVGTPPCHRLRAVATFTAAHRSRRHDVANPAS